ncbi:hypothetical protein HRTV-16_gp53 [Halorubrum virus HRTV-16]|nr:hypothetical protein HRTV-16_gp53 [Halorubrum virus HRTV-16]
MAHFIEVGVGEAVAKSVTVEVDEPNVLVGVVVVSDDGEDTRLSVIGEPFAPVVRLYVERQNTRRCVHFHRLNLIGSDPTRWDSNAGLDTEVDTEPVGVVHVGFPRLREERRDLAHLLRVVDDNLHQLVAVNEAGLVGVGVPFEVVVVERVNLPTFLGGDVEVGGEVLYRNGVRLPCFGSPEQLDFRGVILVDQFGVSDVDFLHFKRDRRSIHSSGRYGIRPAGRFGGFHIHTVRLAGDSDSGSS